MTTEEFLIKETRDLIESYKTHGSIPPTFTLLFNDGSSTSIGLISDKKNYKFLMQKLCENTRVIACIFTSEGWSSSSDDETKSASECADKEEIIILLYSTRQNIHECHIYKPTKYGKLELISVNNAFQGRLSNPFGSANNLSKSEKETAIHEFQGTICETICNAFEKLHYLVPMMFFLTNTPAKVSLCRITEDEWLDRISLRQRISSECEDLETLAFMLEFPVDPDIISVILVSGEIQEIFNYKINPESQKLEFVDKDIYEGEFSRVFKNNMLQVIKLKNENN